MVVDLPQPLEPRKAEDFPALDAEVDPIHGDEIAEAHGQVVGLDGDLRRALVSRAWRDHQRLVATAPGFGQQRDEGRFQILAGGARQQFGRRAGIQHAALVHGHQPVETLRLVHVGGRHQHAHAGTVTADARDQLPELAARQWVDAGGGFVEDQQVRVVDQRAAQPQLLLHAARQLAGRALGEGRQTGAVGQIGDALAALFGILAEQAAEEIQVLEHGEGRVEILAQPLGHVGDARADPAAMAFVGHVAIEHPDLALLDAARPGDQREQAGLADSVGADQADHAVGRDFQADVVQRTGGAVAQRQLADAHHRRLGIAHGVTLICRCSGHSAAASSFR